MASLPDDGDPLTTKVEYKNEYGADVIDVYYIWDKPATVMSVYIANGKKVTPGRELMNLDVPGRSKAKFKAEVGGIITYVNPGLVASGSIAKGQKLFSMQPKTLVHDSLDSNDPNANKKLPLARISFPASARVRSGLSSWPPSSSL